jgi:hypothetical protein
MGTGRSFPRAWGLKLTTHLHVVPRPKIVGLYLYFPINIFME